MSSWIRLPLLLWAAREVLRRPRRHGLLALCLATLSAIAAVPLLLAQACGDTASALLAAGPSLVVRRVNPAGWVPMPAAEAVEHAAQVVGVTEAKARIWGVARGPSGPVTILGLPPAPSQPSSAVVDGTSPGDPPLPPTELSRLHRLLAGPAARNAVVGPGLTGLARGATVTLVGARWMDVTVVGALDDELSMVAHDLVILQVDDARELLGIEAGHASDLALQVFHEQEEEAIVPDLAQAFPWPVQISRRGEMLRAYNGGASRRGSLATMMLVPAILALALIVLGAWRDVAAQRRELALLRALGWTTGDIVGLRVTAGLCVGLPAIAAGLALAYHLVFSSGASWVGDLLFGWTGSAVALTLSPSGAAWILLEVGAIVLLPYLVAILLSALRNAPLEADAAPLAGAS